MKIHIRTYGCQMNERDSECAAAMLAADGHEIVESEDAADLLLFNTCSVRDQAERKAVGKLEIMKCLRETRPGMLYGIMGCMAQSRGEELLKEIPHLNFAVGTDRIHELPEIVAHLTPRTKKASLEHDTIRDAEGLGSHRLPEGAFRAYISIMRGCNRFCSYCIVPYVRGRERSRSPEAILHEAQSLADAGIKEIMLLGQNVAAYGMDGLPKEETVNPFADLLDRLAEIDGIRRIRFTSPHPAFFNRRLRECVASNPKVCKQVHLPLQSGSDRVLKAMNRPYTAAQFLHIAEELRRLSPDIAFSTDVIVGYPTETAEEFEMTKNLMEKIGFDLAYIFKYSPRRGTRSAELADDVPTEEKERRNQVLLSVLERSSEAANRRCVGKILEVLAEGPSRRNPARWSGRTDGNRLAVFTPPAGIRPGDFVTLKIVHATAMTLFGEVV